MTSATMSCLQRRCMLLHSSVVASSVQPRWTYRLPLAERSNRQIKIERPSNRHLQVGEAL